MAGQQRRGQSDPTYRVDEAGRIWRGVRTPEGPATLAELKEGEVVLDLGSGGGIDVLLSARRVGPTGKAYGLDMTDEMLELARHNQREAGVENVDFELRARAAELKGIPGTHQLWSIDWAASA